MRARADPSGSACTATLVAVDTKYQLLSQPLTRRATKEPQTETVFLVNSLQVVSATIRFPCQERNRLDCNYAEVFDALHPGRGQQG